MSPSLAWFEKLEGREPKIFPPLPFKPLILAPSELGGFEGKPSEAKICCLNYPHGLISHQFQLHGLHCQTKTLFHPTIVHVYLWLQNLLHIINKRNC